MGRKYKSGDYQDYITEKKAPSPPEKACKACGNKFVPVDAHGRVSTKQFCNDPECERRRETQRKKRGRKRRGCDKYAVIENRRNFERDIWQLLRHLYVEVSGKVTVSGKVDGFKRIYPKQTRGGEKRISGLRKFALQRLYSSHRIPKDWVESLLEYICRRSAPPRTRFWVALRRGVLPDEVLRPFVLDMIDHSIPDQRSISLLRDLDVGVWIPPEKSDPPTNERLVSFRPVFREARLAHDVAFGAVPSELFLENALESVRGVSSWALKLAKNKKEEFEWQMEALARRTSKYRQRFY